LGSLFQIGPFRRGRGGFSLALYASRVRSSDLLGVSRLVLLRFRVRFPRPKGAGELAICAPTYWKICYRSKCSVPFECAAHADDSGHATCVAVTAQELPIAIVVVGDTQDRALALEYVFATED
jgi:hypothetical protein